MRISNFCFIIIYCLFYVSCSQEDMEGESLVSNSTSDSFFRLNLNEYGELQTRASGESMKFDRLDYYIYKETGEFVANIKHVYHPEEGSINVGGLKDGDYYLFILAVKGESGEDGASIARLNGGLVENWLTVGNASKTLQADYYYKKHSFSVENGIVSDQNVALSHISGLVDFQFIYQNQYTEASVEEITVLPSASFVANCFDTEEGYTGSDELEAINCGDGEQHVFRLMPTIQGSKFEGDVQMKFTRHNGEKILQTYHFSTEIRQNERSVVRIEVKHPDDNVGLLFVTDRMYARSDRYTILTDNEPKETYYSAAERSFYVNKPLQVSINEDNKLHIRLYSPVAIENVTIYARMEGKQDYYEFAYFRNIPSFSDAVFELPRPQRKVVYQTETGRYDKVDANDLYGTAMDFKIVSDDPYWQKIEKIRTKWYITFNSYGADPDDPASHNGNWRGMRPVHIREAVALMTNIAYMCTMDAFKAHVLSFQGQFKDNAGAVIDAASVIPRLESLVRFNTGLIWTGNGVIGLGGGYTLGVYQNNYLFHYDNYSACHTVFHELGHCMGYSHASTMSYGVWAEQCANHFYVDNIALLPVNSPSILNSRNNPNKF